MLALAARGGLGWRHAIWGVPGGAGITRLLEFSAFGARPERWFSQLSASAPGLHPRYAWSVRAIRLASFLAGRPLPAPRHVPFTDPREVVAWMAATLRAGQAPHLHAFSSAVVEVCRAAAQAGMSLGGAHFTMASEPATPARLAAARASGAEVRPCYAMIEFGPLGYGCLAPDAADEMHFLKDLHALIQAPTDEVADIPAGTLLVTPLRPTAPFMGLNVSTGDHATVTQRACGCAMQALGWTTHLHEVHSLERITVGGMTLFADDLVAALENVLPARFGGQPTDYQLAQVEHVGGRPGLELVVHPRVGPVDEAAIVRAFLAEIGPGSGAQRLMALTWDAAGIVTVKRRPPARTDIGKIPHFRQ
jgi:hypothetical protein